MSGASLASPAPNTAHERIHVLIPIRPNIAGACDTSAVHGTDRGVACETSLMHGTCTTTCLCFNCECIHINGLVNL